MNKLIVITGQTATGKTKFAIKYLRRFNGELINADSRQVYKYLDIITGKDKGELVNVPIHLYDVADPKEHFSSFDFKTRAERVIKDILKRGKMPIVVGGTYLYISHLLYGIDTENIKPDFKLRKRLEDKSVAELQKLLGEKELAKLNQSDRNNPRRLMRRIEIITSQRQSKRSSRHPRGGEDLILDQVENDKVKIIGLRFKTKERLEKAIKQRVKKRLKQGAVEELKKLLAKGYKLTDPGMKTNGCKEISEFLKGNLTKEQLVEKWTTIETQYAKRQFIFMKRDKNIKWIEA